MGKTAKPTVPEATAKIDASSVSIAIASPSLGCVGGMAHAAEQIALTLQRLGARVGVIGNPNRVGYDTGLSAGEEADPSATILSLHEPIHWRRDPSRRLAGIITEPTAIFPAAWSTGLAQAEHVLCPSEWVLEGARAAVRSAVLVPFGIDTATFTPSKRERGAKLRVLFFATRADDRRKGLDLAIEAFKRAFPRRSDVELIVRSTERHNLVKDDERMRFEFGMLTPEQLAELYRSCDVLLHPSRAEAFGAVPLEAMATGMPAIHSGVTGMAAYMDFGLVVSTRPVPGVHGEWREAHLSALIERLRHVDEQYDAVAKRAHHDARAVAQRFSWEATVASLLPIIAQ